MNLVCESSLLVWLVSLSLVWSLTLGSISSANIVMGANNRETLLINHTGDAETIYTSRTLKHSDDSDETNALLYLQKYGYIAANSNAETNNLVSGESFSSAVLNFQKFAGIPETGSIDDLTLQYMRMPRCGNPDQSQASSKMPVTFGRLRTVVPRALEASARVSARRRKRYALQGSKWRRQELSYRISQYPTKFSGKRHEVDAQIEKAFGIWSQVAPIDFVPKRDGRVHIDIRFASGDHGDGDSFDGPGNTLAHAYFPQYGGDAHFDDQEYWTIDSYTGTNIFQVAAHELGHSLGLGHSNVREALMAPFYQKYKPNFKLHVDDILAIQALYGEKASASGDKLPDEPLVPPILPGDSLFPLPRPVSTTTTTTTTTSTTTSTTTTTTPSPETTRDPARRRWFDHEPAVPDLNTGTETTASGSREIDAHEQPEQDGQSRGAQPPSQPAQPDSSIAPVDLCVDSMIDAVTRTEDGNSYVFRGDHYWLLTGEGVARGYPRRIDADWDGLTGPIDAALTWADGKTFFFKGNKYWRYRNKERDLGYPKLISAGFAGLPDDIDAAFVWSGNGRTYVFKGTEYWRFDSKADPPVSADYPKPIKIWTGVPSHINAAFKWSNNVTYFFKGNKYYRFNDRDFKVESKGRPPFPRYTAEWWFGCVNSNLAQRALPASSAFNSALESLPAGMRASLADNTIGSGQRDWALLPPTSSSQAIGWRPMGPHSTDRRRSLNGVDDMDEPLGVSDHQTRLTVTPLQHRGFITARSSANSIRPYDSLNNYLNYCQLLPALVLINLTGLLINGLSNFRKLRPS